MMSNSILIADPVTVELAPEPITRVWVLSGKPGGGAKGDERRFGPGDAVSFPAGSVCTWLVKERIRKVAVLKESLWRPLGMCVTMTARLRGLARAVAQRLRKSHAKG